MTEQGAISLAQVVEKLELTVAAGQGLLERPVKGAQVCDLLSHVMAQAEAGQLWITIQTHSNIVAVAALTRLSGIVIAGGFTPEDETVGRAEDEGIPLLVSAQQAYELAGELYELGVR